MPIIEKISQMQKSGVGNEEIIRKLQEEGISPKEISEALDQSKVKSAIETGEEMQPSVMDYPSMAEPTTTSYNNQGAQMQQFPSTAEMPAQEQMPMQMPEAIQEQMPMEEGYNYPYPGQQQYQDYEYAKTDTGTMTEIAEQIVNEKLQKIEKQILEATAFRTEAVGKMVNVDERLRRIEMMIDRLQVSILGRIGEDSRNISDLKEEMLTTQESFSKILNPLTENIEELRKITGSATKTRIDTTNPATKHETTVKKQKKGRDGFEDYLRE